MEIDFVSLLFVFICLYALQRAILRLFPGPLYWQWDNMADGITAPRQIIDTDKLHFPSGFLWGTATAAHQVEGGCTNNQWFAWEDTKDEKGKYRIHNNDKSANACEHWARYEQDIKLMKDIHCNSYRFSVEWSKIQPAKEVFDLDAIIHYKRVLECLETNGIVPMITFSHFSHPLWFDELGAWEKQENIVHFVNFCERVYIEYSPWCKLWCTINEPEVYVFSSFFAGIFPPGKKDPALAGKVLFHLLEAHIRVYQRIKSLKGGQDAQVGIVKDIFQLDPLVPYNPLDIFVAKAVNHLMNECILDFFKTGVCEWTMFPSISMKYVNKDAPKTNDFIGLNYYSHYHVSFTLGGPSPFRLTHQPWALSTDMSYPIYPEGFYRALESVSKLKIPIYVTENGIADRLDDRRALYLRRYLYAMSKAIEDGMDVRGYFYWSLMDNFEWAEGYNMKFGLYEVDFQSQKRKLRPGAQHFVEVAKRFSNLPHP